MYFGRSIVILCILANLMGANKSMADAKVTQQAKAFLQAHQAKVRPLEIAANLAWWNANTSGKESDFEKKGKAENRLNEYLSNSERFKTVKALYTQRKQIDDSTLARAIEVVYLSFLEKQVDEKLLKKMVELQNSVEKKFNVFRAEVDDKKLPDSEVRKVLKTSTSSERRQAVWEASKKVGKVLEEDLLNLVKYRNQAAKQLGFKNFHELKLYINEQNGKELIALFDELDELTREPFAKAKQEIDVQLAKRCNIKVEDLRPWHYHDPFFQETPAVFKASIDQPYQKTDLLDLSSRFYKSIGLPIDDVIARSDMKPRDGKSPHAFCTDIDRSGDVRVLCNIVQNAYWASTCLHEFGHAVYSSKNIPQSLPYVLRDASHILTTEGVAMMFERVTKNPKFLKEMNIPVEDAEGFAATGAKMLRYQLLIFSRWCQVMLRFEKGMYENPEQDLNKLWWDLVEKYQMVKRPENRSSPDYASKIHVVSAPVYYHNYMMGELFASQVHHAIVRELYNDADPRSVVYVGSNKVGEFMKKRVFEPGRLLSWNALTKHATGKKLNAKSFAEDFKSK